MNLRFVVHEHNARNLHYDFRLEMHGVLKSWAIPKGPSMNPADKRLAVLVEDHFLEYIDFEGIIPEGEYGAGPVVIWDHGTYDLVDNQSDKLIFSLKGDKLKGEFTLLKLKGDEKGDKWLLIKNKDTFADPEWKLVSCLTPEKLEELREKIP